MAFEGQLRPFQEEAVSKLLSWGGRGLLAMIMGAGKTPTSIALLEQLLDEEEVESGLIVTPPGIKRQWVKALEKFAPGSNVVLIHGTPKERHAAYERARGWAEYTILGYPQLLDDWEFVRGMPRDFVVADEVQAIKNFRAKRSKKLKQLGGDIRIGLSGQPLENRPEDVFSIMEWIDPEVLGRFDIFDRTFVVRNSWGRPLRYRNLPRLKEVLEREAMVRYSRDDIKDQLPAKTEETYVIDFDRPGASLYKIITRDLVDALDAVIEAGGGKSFDLHAHYRGEGESEMELALRGKVMARLTCLRMLCDHPDLLRVSADAYQRSQSQELSGSLKTGSAYAAELAGRGLLDKKYGTPKMNETVELLKELLDADPRNKIAVFSFFKPVLTWLQEAIPEVGSVLYTGDVKEREKQAAVDAFNTDPRVRIFFSSDAGGAGVDLPAGNYHINYNLPFSAGQLEQRNARLDRIASTHEKLLVISHLMANSVEEYYYSILLRRRTLSQAAIDGKRVKKGSVSMDLGSLKSFLMEKVV